MKIPRKNRDLRRYVIRRDTTRIILYALWITMWCAGTYSYNQNHQTYPPERLITGWKLLLLISASALVGFFLFRMWKFFTDRTYEGVIEASDLSHTYTHSNDPGKSMQYDFRLNTALRVRLPNGKKRKLRFEQKNGFYHYYYEGTRIQRFHGLPYPVSLTDDPGRGYICAACGRIYHEIVPYCEGCIHSLIDPKDLKSSVESQSDNRF